MIRRRIPGISVAVTAIAFATTLPVTPVRAQLACMTSNCAQAPIPAACQNRATPSTAVVLMTGTFVFNPASPKIEPGDCVQWKSTAFTHSSSADPCPDDVLTSCTTASPPSCLWDSGDDSAAGTPPATVCYYDPATYPATTADGFYCRIHDNPQHTGTMHGTLQVTTPIQLAADKNVATGDVVLTWTGGGVSGDVTYKVVRSDAGDPTFPVAGITTLNPDGSTAGVQFTDVGELGNPATRYYLVRNRQINE